MRHVLAFITICSLLVSACASAGGPRVQGPNGTPSVDPALFAAYVKQLPIGSRVRVELTSGRRFTATLMKAGDDAIVVQARARFPEPPIEVPLVTIAAVELDQGGGAGRAIGIGIAAGAGGALALFLVLAAIFAGN